MAGTGGVSLALSSKDDGVGVATNYGEHHDFLSRVTILYLQGCRFPDASMAHAFSILRVRISGSFAESIQSTKSLRAFGVRSLH